MKKFIGYIMIILLFCGSICGIVFGIQLMKTNKTIDNLYTQEEVEYKYQQYIDQISEKNVVIDDLNNQLTILTTENTQQKADISNLQNSISEKDNQLEILTSERLSLITQVESLTAQVSDLTSQIEVLSASQDTNLEKIQDLQLQKTNLENQVETLNNSLNEKNTEIDNLIAEKVNLEEEVSTLTAQVLENESVISNLNSQILLLQSEIEKLNQLLGAYDEFVNQSIIITYYVSDDLFDTQVISRGETTNQSLVPEDTYQYSFVKWQIDGEDFDFETYKFMTNTRIDAVLEEKLYVKNVDGSFDNFSLDNNSIIPRDFFRDNTDIQEIYIPSFVKTIESNAFYGCSNLKTVYTPSLQAWMSIDFLYDSSPNTMYSNPMRYADNIYVDNQLVENLIIPDGISIIKNFCFLNWESLKTIIFNESLSLIGEWAFMGCSNVESVYVSSLENYFNISFYDSSSTPLYNGGLMYFDDVLLTDLVIPEDVIILDAKFAYNTSLKSIRFSNSLQGFVDGSFMGCSNLENVYCSSLEQWLNFNFDNVRFTPFFSSSVGKLYINDVLLENCIVPDSVSEIKAYAFYKCKSLKSVVLPESIVSIGKEAFSGCSNLKEINLPNSITIINEEAFANTGLTHIALSSGITELYDGTFANCLNLQYVYIPTSVIYIRTGNRPFSGCSNINTFYCESETRPSGWHKNSFNFNDKCIWNSSYNDYLLAIGVEV